MKCALKEHADTIFAYQMCRGLWHEPWAVIRAPYPAVILCVTGTEHCAWTLSSALRTCSPSTAPPGSSILGPIRPKKVSIALKAMGFPVGSVVKNLPASAGDSGSIPGSGRSPGGENGNPLQHACLEIPHGQRNLAYREPTAHGVLKDLGTQQWQ